MQIVSFSEFSRRRGVLGQPAIPAGPALAATDRWAMLHSQGVDDVREDAVSEVPAFVSADGEADFWSDLQFRIAYPTHRLRRH